MFSTPNTSVQTAGVNVLKEAIDTSAPKAQSDDNDARRLLRSRLQLTDITGRPL